MRMLYLYLCLFPSSNASVYSMYEDGRQRLTFASRPPVRSGVGIDGSSRMGTVNVDLGIAYVLQFESLSRNSSQLAISLAIQFLLR